MSIVFVVLHYIKDINVRGIYEDLIRKFRDSGHKVYVVTPLERRESGKTKVAESNNISILTVRTLNITQTNILEKAAAMLLIDLQFLKAIKKYYSGEHFDLVIYSTPPITLTKTLSYIKRKNSSRTYLLLKDIFPQNAVDLGMIKKGSLIHWYFRRIEKKLYKISDFIGCMSQANVDYILKHNPQIKSSKTEVNPNSLEPVEDNTDLTERKQVRKKYQIPEEAVVFIYGGSLGKPQGIDFLIEVLDHQKNNNDIFFIIIGSGTEYKKIEKWHVENKGNNALIMPFLQRSEYDLLIKVCDVGMIFLDKRFTIPNFPSRLLSYLENKIPVIAATDKSTDLRIILEDNKIGFWSEAGDIKGISKNISAFSTNRDLRIKMGLNGYKYLTENYTVTKSYDIIMKHFELNSSQN